MRIRNLWLFAVVAIGLLISCGKEPEVTVRLTPAKPVAGEKVTVKFKPRRLLSENANEQKITMIAQVLAKNAKENIAVPMNLKGSLWTAEIPTDSADCLISVKFEDQMDRVEDNRQWGWNFVLYEKDQKTPRENSYFLAGKIYSGETHSGSKADLERAKQAFEKELRFHPDNYGAMFGAWQSALAISGNSEIQKRRIAEKLDSLKLANANNSALSILQFDASLGLLNDRSRSLAAGTKIVNSQDHSEDAERVRFTMAFITGNGKRDAILSNLENFAQNTTSDQYRKVALRRLAEEFQKDRQTAKAIQFYHRFLEIEPDNIPVMLALATSYLKSGDTEKSEEFIEKAKEANSPAYYLRANPWMRPSERAGEMTFNLCHILSTQAELFYTKGDFPSAIASRKESIEKGSLFPAFEWEKIGDIYREIGSADSALTAFSRAVAINKNQQSAVDKMRALFLADGGNKNEFPRFLKQRIQRELASMSRPAPDCQLTELDGKKVNISDFKGKVVLVSFWDIWSDASRREIRQLNQLKQDFLNESDVEFLAISIETANSVRRYINENPFSFRLFYSGYNAKQDFGVIGFPSHYLIDRNGKIVYKHIGYANNLRHILKNEINQLLAKKREIS